MIEAYIYDAVRTPRGKGKKDGSLHQATPVWLLRTLLQALQQRNQLDTSLVDDVVLGCVTPVGEQGADIARTAVLDAGWAETVAGVTHVFHAGHDLGRCQVDGFQARCTKARQGDASHRFGPTGIQRVA